MNWTMFKYFGFFFVLLQLGDLRAQGTDSLWHTSLIRLYTDSLGENLQLYEGFEFASGYRRSAGHPFFEFEQPSLSRITYKNSVYEGVYLAYDLTRDEIISINPASRQFIQLIKSKINSFTIGGHQFVHLRPDSVKTAFPGEGFYDLLLEGPMVVYARRRKSLREPARAEDPARFVPSTTYYIEKNGTYYLVDSRKSLLKICGDHRSEVSKYMQSEKLDFKREREQTIIRVIRFYQQFLK